MLQEYSRPTFALESNYSKTLKMKKLMFFGLAALVTVSSCIKDDIIFDTVEESLKITNPIDTLGEGDTYLFETRFLNNIGMEESQTVTWSSSDEAILTVDQNGLTIGISKGTAVLSVEVELEDKAPVRDEIQIVVAEQTVVTPTTERTGELQTTSSYVLEGSFTLKETTDGLSLELADNYKASSSLPGLYVYLTNNPNSTSGGFEIGMVNIFNGAHSFALPSSVEINQYDYVLYFCKPFGVKVGHGEFE